MRTDNAYLKLVLALTLIGILVAGWLLSTHISFSTGQASLTEPCLLGITGNTEGCATIAVSKYSDVFGIPLAAIALGYYIAQLLLVFWAMRNYQASYEALYVSFFLATLAVVVTVTMFYISKFVLQSFCLGCSVLWLVNLSLWPCLVKHLGLRWGTALAANLELVRPKDMNLNKGRIRNAFAVAGLSVGLIAIVGTVAESLQAGQVHSAPSAFIEEYNNAPQVFLSAEAVGGPQSKGMTSGSEAPVMEIHEFSDFQCPACRMAAQLLRPFLLKHADKVRFTYHHFPLDGSCNPFAPNGRHMSACAASRLAICASREGKFWPVHDLIFDNQDELSSSKLDAIAGEAGLDKAKLSACLSDPATENQLQKEMQWGDMIGLESTPTFVINGRRFAGARSPSDLEALLKHLEREKKR